MRNPHSVRERGRTHRSASGWRPGPGLSARHSSLLRRRAPRVSRRWSSNSSMRGCRRGRSPRAHEGWDRGLSTNVDRCRFRFGESALLGPLRIYGSPSVRALQRMQRRQLILSVGTPAAITQETKRCCPLYRRVCRLRMLNSPASLTAPLHCVASLDLYDERMGERTLGGSYPCLRGDRVIFLSFTKASQSKVVMRSSY